LAGAVAWAVPENEKEEVGWTRNTKITTTTRAINSDRTKKRSTKAKKRKR
jgi:hypothetical protein